MPRAQQPTLPRCPPNRERGLDDQANRERDADPPTEPLHGQRLAHPHGRQEQLPPPQAAQDRVRARRARPATVARALRPHRRPHLLQISGQATGTTTTSPQTKSTPYSSPASNAKRNASTEPKRSSPSANNHDEHAATRSPTTYANSSGHVTKGNVATAVAPTNCNTTTSSPSRSAAEAASRICRFCAVRVIGGKAPDLP